MRRDRIDVRPATREDVIRNYGSCDFTLFAYVGELNGDIVGFGGVVLAGGRAIAFYEIDDRLRERPVFLTKMALLVLRRARQAGHRHIFCIPEPGEPRARPWLEKIGFVDTGNGAMEWQPYRS